MLNPLMLKMLAGAIPPEVRAQAQAAFEQLQRDGRTEITFDVPGIGPCKVTVEKVRQNETV